ncbi:MAG: redoxin family protein, partial [Minisyncoccia bacterium]
AEGRSAQRALVITASLGASMFFFTLILKATTALIAVPALFWQILSGCLLLLFGVATLFPALWDRLPVVNALYRSSNITLGAGYQKKNWQGDIIIGAALGPVFSSCSPTYFVILAAVLPVNLAVGVLYLLAYVVGLSLSLFVIAALGQRAALALGAASDPNGRLRKAVGALFIIVGIAVVFGLDKKLEAALPQGAFAEIGIEQHLLSASKNATSTAPASGAFLTPQEKAARYEKAPELEGIAGYINTGGKPILLSQYAGKDVVLVDFWDYSCINCERSIPYVETWYQKYKNEGLVVIGVHTPEFAFEQVPSNVENAVKQFGITYPVVLDNQYKTWNAFQNEYWPNEYLIDIDGYVVYQHSGEGDYDETEQAIQAALAEGAARLGTTTTATSTIALPSDDLSAIESPETYFGSDRNEYLGNGIPGATGEQSFSLPVAPEPNTLYLDGSWNIQPQYAQGSAGTAILYEYDAHDIYMVAANAGGQTKIKILLDGKPVGNLAGADVNPTTSEAAVNGDRLYRLVHDTTPGVHIIQIEVESGTLDAYTFTFG